MTEKNAEKNEMPRERLTGELLEQLSAHCADSAHEEVQLLVLREEEAVVNHV